MKSIKQLSSMIIVTMTLGLISSTGMAQTTIHSKANNPSVLFSQMAPKAVLSAGKKSGWYTLTLKGVNRSILWFTDRPVRKSGTMNNADFLKTWNSDQKDSFAKNNPNGNLVASLAKGQNAKEQVYTVRLADPSYNAEAKSMQYQVQFSSSDGQAMPSQKTLYNAALFIDNIGCGFCL